MHSGALYCSWCEGDMITVTAGLVDPHKVVETDTSSCPGSGKAPKWTAERLVLNLDGWDSNLARFHSEWADTSVQAISVPTSWWMQRGQPAQITVTIESTR